MDSPRFDGVLCVVAGRVVVRLCLLTCLIHVIGGVSIRSCTNVYSGSGVCCSWINNPCCWNVCIQKGSQQLFLCPFLHVFNSSTILCILPYSCLLCKIYNAYVDFRFFFFMYLLCSSNLVISRLPVCPMYDELHVLHVNLYIPLAWNLSCAYCRFCNLLKQCW